MVWSVPALLSPLGFNSPSLVHQPHTCGFLTPSVKSFGIILLYWMAGQQNITWNSVALNTSIAHKENNSSNSACTMMGSELIIATEEWHLGLIMDSGMKLWAHCTIAIKKGNWMLRIIKEGIENQTEIIVMPLKKCILDLHLENCVLFLSFLLKRL